MWSCTTSGNSPGPETHSSEQILERTADRDLHVEAAD